MKTQIRLLVILAMISPLAACGDDGSGPDGGPQPIETGRWSATADFGTFEIMVAAPSGDAISEITYRFSGFQCGSGGTISGGMTIGTSSGWPIVDRSFEIENDLNPDPFGDEHMLMIRGSFGSSGRNASGTWSGDWPGGACSGNWSGAPM